MDINNWIVKKKYLVASSIIANYEAGIEYNKGYWHFKPYDSVYVNSLSTPLKKGSKNFSSEV